jgi:hypothetical protein
MPVDVVVGGALDFDPDALVGEVEVGRYLMPS